MQKQLFNPFEDRQSRDIRNELSAGLASAIETGSTEKLTAIVGQFRQQPLAEYYHEYLEDRYGRYQQALGLIEGTITEPIAQGVVLWNLGLFFEVHEVLEHAWYSAQGERKQTLQALIRAAGVYIKREYGFNDSAARIAAKAIPVLTANQDILQPYFKVEELTAALKTRQLAPPILQQR